MDRREKIHRNVLYGLFGFIALALLAWVWFSAAREEKTPHVVSDFVMDTFVEIKLYGKDGEAGAKAVQSLLRRMEQ